MFDKLLAIETLKNIENSLYEVVEWRRHITSVDDFVTLSTGMILLNALVICYSASKEFLLFRV